MAFAQRQPTPLNGEAQEVPSPVNAISSALIVGQLLKDTRKSLGLSLLQVAQKIHVRVFYLEALEKGDLKNIPGNLYILGFVRLYARVLDLDGDELLRRLHLHMEDTPLSTRSLQFSSRLDPSHFVLYLSLVMGILSFGLLYIVFFFPLSSSPPPSMDELPPIMEVTHPSANTETQPLLKDSFFSGLTTTNLNNSQKILNEVDQPEILPLSDLTPSSSSVPFEKPLSSQINKRLIIGAMHDCWVEIRRKDKVIFSKILKAGESYTLEQAEECFLSLGNAGGVSLEMEGKILAPLGNLSQVVRNIALASLLGKAFT